MKILKSKWRTSSIVSVDIGKLTPMYQGVRVNDHTNTCDNIAKRGMIYPLVCVKMTESQWMKQTNDPCYTLNSDGFVWVVDAGRSRLAYAKEKGFDQIECLFFNTLDESTRMDQWLSVADPHNNHKSPPLISATGLTYDQQNKRKSMTVMKKVPPKDKK